MSEVQTAPIPSLGAVPKHIRKFYLAGPMRGLPNHNYPAFNAAASILRGKGFAVFNPAESFGGDATQDPSVYFHKDFKELLRCDAIALLNGWVKSEGASVEFSVAKLLGLRTFALCYMPTPPRTLTVHGEEGARTPAPIPHAATPEEDMLNRNNWYLSEFPADTFPPALMVLTQQGAVSLRVGAN